MEWYYWAGAAVTAAAIVADIVLALADRKTLSQYVADSFVPNWVWYALGIGLLAGTFWFVVPSWISGLVLLAWLLGHFAEV